MWNCEYEWFEGRFDVIPLSFSLTRSHIHGNNQDSYHEFPVMSCSQYPAMFK